MPNKDGKGPVGIGPLTGSCLGHCAVPLNTPEEELSYLKDRKKSLKDQLRQIESRIKELEKAVLSHLNGTLETGVNTCDH
jgi:hypothetical protein